MKKIVILGVENSHADSFLDFIFNDKVFSGIEVVGVYSDEDEAIKRITSKFDVPVMKNFDEAVGKVDGVIITARHGDNHYKYAKPYIKSGVPMFIDKPITISKKEGIRFMTELKNNNVKISGGSLLKHDSFVKSLKEKHENAVGGETLSAFIRAPLMINSPYGGFYFYAQHLVEISSEIFGKYPLSVQAVDKDGDINLTIDYGDFLVFGSYVNSTSEYFVLRNSKEGVESASVFNNEAKECSKREFKEYYDILFGGESKVNYKDFIAPVFFMNAIYKSLKKGKKVKVEKIKL